MTPAAILADLWANKFADRIEAGKGDEIEDEDEDFDLDAILAANEAEAEAEAKADAAVAAIDDFEEVPRP